MARNNHRVFEPEHTNMRETVDRIGGKPFARSPRERGLRLLSYAITLVLTLVLLQFWIAGNMSYADVIWMDSGVVGDKLISGEYEYQEYTFITGEPVLLKGIVKLPAPIDVLTAKSNVKQGYTFDLASEDGSITVKRTVTFDVKLTKRPELSQIQQERKISNIAETMVTPNGTYVLGKFNFLESRIYDVTAAVAYQSGNAIFERSYYLNGNAKKNEGILSVVTEVRPIVGYQHKYGAQESYVVKQKYNLKKTDGKGFGGTVTVGLSSLQKTVFDYQYTDPQNISFRGSFFQYKTDENVLDLRYDFLNGDKRTGSSKRLNNKVTTDSVALPIPVLRDMGGRPTERAVLLLTALEAFDASRVYFVPTASITRHDFAKALYAVIKGALPQPTKNEVKKRYRPGVETPFLDIQPDHEDYHYIEQYKALGIAYGKNNYLKPMEPITRAEAITMVMRTLGIAKVAPAPPYKTAFADDDKIPEWSKDSFYMAAEIGLIKPDDQNEGAFVYPLKVMTKEEAATLLDDLVHHLNEVIRPDYREKIIKK